jgi:uncharacterized protein
MLSGFFTIMLFGLVLSFFVGSSISSMLCIICLFCLTCNCGIYHLCLIIYETFSLYPILIFAVIMQPGSAGSVSRLKIAIEIQDKGSALAEFVRHLAPLTIGTILKSLPLQDRVHRYVDKFVYVETGLIIGPEKYRTQFHRGDIAYLTSNSSICVFVQDAKVQPMNLLGVVTSNLEVIESSSPGDVMIVKEASV